LIAEDITHAGIGQFVKITGLLKVLDLTIIKRITEHPTLAKMLAAANEPPVVPQGGNRAERKRNEAASRHASSKRPSEGELGMAMASLFGMTTQAHILNKDASVWCTLREKNLVVSAADLLLQHGILIAGSWTAVGILDAKPGSSTVHNTGADDGASTPFADALMLMIPSVRNLIGRPEAYFGVTPLLIFRQIVG
jgi:hypothetical protein